MFGGNDSQDRTDDSTTFTTALVSCPECPNILAYGACKGVEGLRASSPERTFTHPCSSEQFRSGTTTPSYLPTYLPTTGEHESFERGRNLAHGSSTNPIDIDNTRPADLEQLGSSGRNDSGRLAYGSSNEPQSGGQRASGNNADPYASSKAFSGDRAGHGYSQDSPEHHARIGRHGPSDTSQGTDSADSYGSANTNRGSNNNTESYGSSTQDSSNDNGDAFSPHGNRDTRGESNFDNPSHSANNSLANKDRANNDSSSYGNANSNSNPEGDNSCSSSDKQGSWDQKVIQSGASTVGYNLDDTMAREIGESMKKLL